MVGKSYQCSKCEKTLSNYYSHWRHKKSCNGGGNHTGAGLLHPINAPWSRVNRLSQTSTTAVNKSTNNSMIGSNGSTGDECSVDNGIDVSSANTSWSSANRLARKSDDLVHKSKKSYSAKRRCDDDSTDGEESTDCGVDTASSIGSSDEENIENDSCGEESLDDVSDDEDCLIDDSFNPFEVTYFYSISQCRKMKKK